MIELESTQEEADTRMLLHSLHASRSRFASVVIVSEDTDVLVLLLAFKIFIPSSVFTKCGSQTRVKYIEVSRVVESVGQLYADHCRAFMHSLAATRSVPLLDGKGSRVSKYNTKCRISRNVPATRYGMEFI